MVLVLAVVWASFGIWWFRSHAAASLGDSVGSFRRDLHVLERTAPATLPAANRLRVPRAAAQMARQAYPTARRSAAVRPGPAPAPARRVPSASRRRAARRRRDVLFVLLVAVVATLVMAVASRSHAMMGIQLLADALLAGYVALLVRMRNLAAEREMKIGYLPSARQAAAPAQRRRPAAGYDGLSYADLAVGRAAAN